MQGADLEQFQFDYDLKWAAVFLHPDGTVLARYGSETAAGPTATLSMKGLRAVMERVLEAHRGYPENRARFVAKRGPRPPHPRADDIPSPIIKKLLGRPGKENCIHCHNIYDAYHDIAAREKSYDPRKLWKYPPPENIGLVLDVDAGNRVERVLPGSAAARAGVRAGDAIEELNGQAIFSIADVQFVLHHLPEETELKAALRRGGERVEAALELSGSWRENDFSWRGSLWNMPPSPGLWTEELKPEEKRKLGIPPERMGLKVRGVFKPPVQRALKAGDVIVAFDGKDAALTGERFAAALCLDHYRPGSVLRLRIRRDGEEREVEVRF